GAEVADVRSQLDWALKTLSDAGFEAHGEIRAGEVEASLRGYAEEHDIDMLVMGAYGHSRVRHLLVGSTTTTMLRRASLPVLLLR
ncbi:MAG: universal stress protein, partial [Onishia taeanensis]